MSRGDQTVTVSANDSDITRASVTAMVDAMDRLVADDSETVIADD
jgi:D-citramalate synthase